MESEARRVGWGRTVLSTYWHWFDAEGDSNGDQAEPIPCVCETIGAYKGHLVPEIARWKTDPSVCEICREIRTARAEGRVSKLEPMQTVAIVPAGLPDRIRDLMESKSDKTAASPPFYVALAKFRSEGITKPFLSAWLRYDAKRIGKPSRIPVKWWDITIDAVRECEGVTRVRLEKEPKRLRPPGKDIADAS